MSLSTFITFPGILILIGVILLLIAIIIGCIAFKKVDENEYTNIEDVKENDDSIYEQEIGTDIPDIDEIPVDDFSDIANRSNNVVDNEEEEIEML